MSWLELRKNRVPAGRLAAAALISLSVAGCLQPLYGPMSTGGTVKDVMASIDLGAVGTKTGQDRIGHYLRNELVFDLDGSGRPSPKRYRLEVSVTESLAATAVNSATGTASAAILTGSAVFTLTPFGGGPVVITGTAVASAPYDRGPQRFADVRAARDAEIRVAKVLAEQIQTRIAATLRNRS